MTLRFIEVDTFEQWRETARDLLRSEMTPQDIVWTESQPGPSLFAAARSEERRSNPTERSEARAARGEESRRSSTETFRRSFVTRVPTQFLKLARTVACHRDAARWELLYRVLWRLTHGERHLLEIASDDDVRRLEMMQKAVSRDAHKAKAFVRFRRVLQPGDEPTREPADDSAAAAGTNSCEHYVAWHRPDHRILRIVAPFFARRFRTLRWTILTPDESVSWDLAALHYGPGVPASSAPEPDVLEDLWRTYYASIFNPARIKLQMMKREMPVRHWKTLPETQSIPRLLDEAPQRVTEMLQRQEGYQRSARDFLPRTAAGDLLTLDALAQAAARCDACDLHRSATQTVFGRGPRNAEIVLVGEQPGDEEDRRGQPFLGPAGQLLDACLLEAGLSRERLYLTNAVKHFKFEWSGRGKRRLHKKPNAREVAACRPWLETELELLTPRAIVCLGVTAAQTLLGRQIRLQQQRGMVVATDWSPLTMATYHPAAILRATSEVRRSALRRALVSDLQRIASLVVAEPP